MDAPRLQAGAGAGAGDLQRMKSVDRSPEPAQRAARRRVSDTEFHLAITPPAIRQGWELSVHRANCAARRRLFYRLSQRSRCAFRTIRETSVRTRVKRHSLKRNRI